MNSFISPNVKRNLAFVNEHLSRHHWFAGDQMTGADFQMIFPLEAAINRSGAAAQLPAIKAWVERVHGLDTYKTALEKGGPYSYA